MLNEKLKSESQLIRFLEEELFVPIESINLALRYCNQSTDRLPIILWQYGLITLQQLDQIFEWLES